MKRMFSTCSAAALTVCVGTWCAAPPAGAQDNRGAASRGAERGGGGGGDRRGRASTGNGNGSGNTSANGTGTSTGSVSSGDGSRATARGDGNSRSSRTLDGLDGVPSYARPRDGKPVIGTATPRTSGPGTTTTRPGIVVLVPGGYYGGFYDPWGYGGYGYGSYGGYYDPWYGGYPAYTQSGSTYSDEGALRLKIKPREAEVYVDGYYVGLVDDFDGIFQRLHLESGPHRVEVRASGYEPLTFDVSITPDHSMTYQGKLKKIQ